MTMFFLQVLWYQNPLNFLFCKVAVIAKQSFTALLCSQEWHVSVILHESMMVTDIPYSVATCTVTFLIIPQLFYMYFLIPPAVGPSLVNRWIQDYSHV